jgi:hypothetical protein
MRRTETARRARCELLLVELDDADGAVGGGVHTEVAEDALVEVLRDDLDPVACREDVDGADFLELLASSASPAIERRPRRR